MKSFGADLRGFVDKEVKVKHKQNTEAVEDYVFNQLRTKSPTCSGTYKSNHNRSVGRPNYTFIYTLKKGSPCGYANMSSTQPQPTGNKDFDTFYVANGAPYAGVIENGKGIRPGLHVYGLAYNSAKEKFKL